MITAHSSITVSRIDTLYTFLKISKNFATREAYPVLFPSPYKGVFQAG